ncbi:hypothetical protein A1D22_03475 [Pasteurellaceae bacterium LFhippo2]|nr:hypothetical protein [Pasteurellaceae bacterium LFhippo2]
MTINAALLKLLKEWDSINSRVTKEVSQKNRKTAPDFTPFNFIWTNEDGISAIIAYLLDPQERHDQGALFLNKFLESVNKPPVEEDDAVYVTLHKATYQNRYHDIFIQIFDKNSPNPKLVISIESKLRGASDQERQVSHYIEDMQRYNKTDYLMIYLVPKGNEPPTEKSILRTEWENEKKKETAKVISADDLIEWLEKSKAEPKHLEIFIEHFIQFLKQMGKMMKNDNSKSSVITEFLTTQNALTIKALFNMLESKEAIYLEAKKQILQRFDNALKQFYEINNHIQECDRWNISENSFTSHSHIAPIYFVNESVAFKICIEGTQASAYWGILRDDLTKDENILDKLRKIETSKPTDKYPIWNRINEKPLWDSPECWGDLIAKDSRSFSSIWGHIENILNVYYETKKETNND